MIAFPLIWIRSQIFHQSKMIVPNLTKGTTMNRFNLLTYTAALALALGACVSTTKPGAVGTQRQQTLVISVDAVGQTVKS